MSRPVSMLLSLAVLMLAGLAQAQEGHPIEGTWRGALQSDADDNRRVLMIMEYAGDAITGVINPGRNSIPIAVAELDAPNWGLHVEAESRDNEDIVIDATLKDIGLRNRYLEGTWEQGGEVYQFRVTRE